ncbi:DNA-binding protein, partial [Rhizobium ruizarguesonis]
KRDYGRLLILTRDGTKIPVSRSYADDVRRRFT